MDSIIWSIYLRNYSWGGLKDFSERDTPYWQRFINESLEFIYVTTTVTNNGKIKISWINNYPINSISYMRKLKNSKIH